MMIYHLNEKKVDHSRTKTEEKTYSAFLTAFFYSSLLFLGSFLLFLLEPLYAKLILPWFGGTSSVWALCLAFFQTTLLLGYGYADFITRRFRPFPRALVHTGLLLSSLWLLPITPHPAWRPQPGSNPAFLILGLLAVQIGLPFFLLSASSPLVQFWYSRRFPGRKPYALFALSNAASLAGLLSFIFLVEPELSSKVQTTLWSWLFALYVAACSWAAWQNRTALEPRRREENEEKKPAIQASQKLMWAGLSAGGSMLLLSITNHLTQNVAPVPFLWVLPLSLYLLSFILVFSREDLYSRKWAAPAAVTALVAMNYAFYEPDFLPILPLKLLVLGLGLLVACLFCHGELARLKPAAAHLTTYYLMVSLGGALGAVFVGLAAPQIFPAVYEYPLSLAFVSVMALFLKWKRTLFARAVWGIIALFIVIVFGLDWNAREKKTVAMMRNFYAPLWVVRQETTNRVPYLTLSNGVIIHGKQFLDPSKAMEGTAYYSSECGAALAVRWGGDSPKRVGLIGLGTGTLAVYGNKDDVFRFYEINPQVVSAANSYFTFLGKSRAKIEIVPGDARLSLEAELPNHFDVLAVDAFSGDAIPVHLLTQEAFELYLRHLKPGGILAFHTSNRHLYLAPVVKQLADHEGYFAVSVKNKKDPERLIELTEWVLVTKNRGFIRMLQGRFTDTEIPVMPGVRLWTDDHNSLLPILR